MTYLLKLSRLEFRIEITKGKSIVSLNVSFMQKLKRCTQIYVENRFHKATLTVHTQEHDHIKQGLKQNKERDLWIFANEKFKTVQRLFTKLLQWMIPGARFQMSLKHRAETCVFMYSAQKQ